MSSLSTLWQRLVLLMKVFFECQIYKCPMEMPGGWCEQFRGLGWLEAALGVTWEIVPGTISCTTEGEWGINEGEWVIRGWASVGGRVCLGAEGIAVSSIGQHTERKERNMIWTGGDTGIGGEWSDICGLPPHLPVCQGILWMPCWPLNEPEGAATECQVK